MSQQNLVSGTLSDQDRDALLAEIQAMRQKLPFLISLTIAERRSFPKMGDGSAPFVDKAYGFAGQNTEKLGSDFGMDDYTADHDLHVQFAPVVAALSQFFEEVSDTDLALRSDLMVRSNLVYALMKVLGKVSGAFDQIRQDMGLRFKGQGQKKTPPPQP